MADVTYSSSTTGLIDGGQICVHYTDIKQTAAKLDNINI